MERTLSLVKPDAVEKRLIGEVVRRFEAAGLRVIGLKMLQLDRQKAEGFYHVHREKNFFNGLIEFITSGPLVAMVLEGPDAISKVRALMGATDPAQAAAGTIRRDFATNVERNVVHGSDADETAKFEVSYFFSDVELCC